MFEALAAALILGGINAIGDFVSAELRLTNRPIYMFARIALICYCVGGLVGARARQLLIGTIAGLAIGLLVAAAYHLLAPRVGWGGLAVAWALFWICFSLLDAVLQGGAVEALVRGAIAVVLSGIVFYVITTMLVELRSSEPNLLRVFAL